MLDRLLARYGAANIAGAAFVGLFSLVFVGLQSIQSASPGIEVGAIVISTGSIALAEVHGGTNEYASLQLADGRKVGALVLHGGPVQPGMQVAARERKRFWGDSVFEVIGPQRIPDKGR